MERTDTLLLLVVLLLAALLLVTYGDYRVRSHVAQSAPQPKALRDVTAAAAPVQLHPVPNVAASAIANSNLTQLSALLLQNIDLDEQLTFLAARAHQLEARADEHRARQAAAAAAKGNLTAGGDAGGGNDTNSADELGLQAELESSLQKALRAAASLEEAQVAALRGRSSADAKLADALEKIAELEAAVDRHSGANYSSRNVLYEPPTRQYKEMLGAQSLAPSCVRALLK
jgi:hypothetical protein